MATSGLVNRRSSPASSEQDDKTTGTFAVYAYDQAYSFQYEDQVKRPNSFNALKQDVLSQMR